MKNITKLSLIAFVLLLSISVFGLINISISHASENLSNPYNTNYTYQTKFSSPVSSTIIGTSGGKLIDFQLEFALAYYNIGETYSFSLYPEKGQKKVASLGKIKIDYPGDQYKGVLKTDKKIKDGYYYLIAENKSKTQTIISEAFQVDTIFYDSINLMENGIKVGAFSFSDKSERQNSIDSCLSTKNTYMIEQGKKMKCVDLKGKEIKDSKSKIKELVQSGYINIQSKERFQFYGIGVATKKEAIKICKKDKKEAPKLEGYTFSCIWGTEEIK